MGCGLLLTFVVDDGCLVFPTTSIPNCYDNLNYEYQSKVV